MPEGTPEALSDVELWARAMYPFRGSVFVAGGPVAAVTADGHVGIAVRDNAPWSQIGFGELPDAPPRRLVLEDTGLPDRTDSASEPASDSDTGSDVPGTGSFPADPGDSRIVPPAQVPVSRVWLRFASDGSTELAPDRVNDRPAELQRLHGVVDRWVTRTLAQPDPAQNVADVPRLELVTHEPSDGNALAAGRLQTLRAAVQARLLDIADRWRAVVTIDDLTHRVDTTVDDGPHGPGAGGVHVLVEDRADPPRVRRGPLWTEPGPFAEPIADPLQPHQWAHRRAAAAVAHIRTVHFREKAEPSSLRVDRPDDPRARLHGLVADPSHRFVSPVALDLRRIEVTPGRWVDEVTVPIELAGPADQTGVLADRAREAIDSALNGLHRFRDGSQLHVRLDIVEVEVEVEVETPAPFVAHLAERHRVHVRTDGVGADQLNWPLESPGGMLVHEVLHFFGLSDRYRGGFQLGGVHDRDGVMGEGAHRGRPRLRQQDLDAIEELLRTGQVVRDARLPDGDPGVAAIDPSDLVARHTQGDPAVLEARTADGTAVLLDAGALGDLGIRTTQRAHGGGSVPLTIGLALGSAGQSLADTELGARPFEWVPHTRQGTGGYFPQPAGTVAPWVRPGAETYRAPLLITTRWDGGFRVTAPAGAAVIRHDGRVLRTDTEIVLDGRTLAGLTRQNDAFRDADIGNNLRRPYLLWITGAAADAVLDGVAEWARAMYPFQTTTYLPAGELSVVRSASLTTLAVQDDAGWYVIEPGRTAADVPQMSRLTSSTAPSVEPPATGPGIGPVAPSNAPQGPPGAPAAADADRTYGPLVEGLPLRRQEARGRTATTLVPNPLLHPLGSLPASVLREHRSGTWLWIVDADREIILGHEDPAAILSREEQEELYAVHGRDFRARTDDPVREFFASLARRGHPSLIAVLPPGSDRGPLGRVGGELLWSDEDGAWRLSTASHRFTDELAVGHRSREIERWLRNVAVRMAAHLGEPVIPVHTASRDPLEHQVRNPRPAEPMADLAPDLRAQALGPVVHDGQPAEARAVPAMTLTEAADLIQETRGRRAWMLRFDHEGVPHVTWTAADLPADLQQGMHSAYRDRYPQGELAALPVPEFIKRLADLGFPAIGLTFGPVGAPRPAPAGHHWLGQVTWDERRGAFLLVNHAGPVALPEIDAHPLMTTASRTVHAAQELADVLGSKVVPLTFGHRVDRVLERVEPPPPSPVITPAPGRAGHRRTRRASPRPWRSASREPGRRRSCPPASRCRPARWSWCWTG
ncbi:hypothetical protein [Pseudonocardia sp. ICBG1293]|uniref:hypothetical protein n=1 Tax=Pseudonocardia sp. ICBG1293 TaxID=2844382 RepID=UPI001CCAB3B6|nr:hypothetical protein [Pseudonocardia sp. ICBG1293]